jgi:hypothetical protein
MPCIVSFRPLYKPPPPLAGEAAELGPKALAKLEGNPCRFTMEAR